MIVQLCLEDGHIIAEVLSETNCLNPWYTSSLLLFVSDCLFTCSASLPQTTNPYICFSLFSSTPPLPLSLIPIGNSQSLTRPPYHISPLFSLSLSFTSILVFFSVLFFLYPSPASFVYAALSLFLSFSLSFFPLVPGLILRPLSVPV